MNSLIPRLITAAFLTVNTPAQLIWVNEFHYDNSGTDVGEFVELVAPASFTDLSSVTLSLYRGSDGAAYGTHKLNTFTAGSTAGDFKFYSKLISGLQNGVRDGFSLDQSGTVLQFLSYEGSFTASAGAASGLTSTDIGVSESSATTSGASLGLNGLGWRYADFTWAVFSDDSPGSPNSGQSFSAVPEPREYGVAAALALLGYAAWRRRCRTVRNPRLAS